MKKIIIHDTVKLTYRPYNTLPLRLFISATFFLLFFVAATKKSEVLRLETEKTVYVGLDTLTFTPENLKKLIEFYDIQFPDVVFEQSRLETANWTSDVWKDNNNGFRHRSHPRKWKGVEMAMINRDHCVFSHWTKSVEHYKLWQQANFKNGSYIDFLATHGYAEDPRYANILKRVTK